MYYVIDKNGKFFSFVMLTLKRRIDKKVIAKPKIKLHHLKNQYSKYSRISLGYFQEKMTNIGVNLYMLIH
jgi:hypothetical protein